MCLSAWFDPQMTEDNMSDPPSRVGGRRCITLSTERLPSLSEVDSDNKTPKPRV